MKLTIDDFLTGLIGAWAESKQVIYLPTKADFSEPILALMPSIREDARGLGLDCFALRVDFGDAYFLDSAKASAYQRGLLEVRISASDGGRYTVAGWASACLGTLPGNPDFYRRWAKRLAEAFNTK